MRPQLIVVEGPDGAGKGTLIEGLLSRLDQAGVPHVKLREPGGTQLGESLRAMLKGREVTIGSRAEALLFAAARAQLIEEQIRPRLDEGTWVILDRFVDSSIAYQGHARGLGVEAVAQMNEFALDGLRPDLTLMLTVPNEIAQQRRHVRDTSDNDRFETEGELFQQRTVEGYRIAAQRNATVRLLDASGTPAQVLDAAWQQLIAAQPDLAA